MKSLIMTLAILAMTACGASADHLATSIDNATEAANKANSKDNNNGTTTSQTSPNGTTVTVETKVTVTTGAVGTTEQADALDGTNWVTKCENGVTYKASFAKGIETLTTNIYQDELCRSTAQSVAQHINYAIDGDNIQFNEGAAGKYNNAEPFQIMTLGNDSLNFSGNTDLNYSRI